MGALATITLLSCAGASRADDSKKPFAVRLGVYLPTDSTARTVASVGANVGLSFFLNAKTNSQTLLSVDLDGTAVSSSGVSVGYGSLGITGRHFSQPGQGSGPYFGAGLGIYTSSITLDGYGSVDNGAKLGAKLLAGIMAKNGSFAEAAYSYTSTNLTGGLTVTYGFRF
jgi:hypothetical protein